MLPSLAGAITVEPAYFLYYVVHIVVDTANTNLFLQKKCRIGNISEPDLNTPCDDETLGIRFASEMNSFYRFVALTFCACYTILATSWSDAAGRCRRPLIFLPIIGIIFKTLFGCLHSYYWHWCPMIAMVSNNLVEMATGGIAFMIFGSQMYICDVSSIESRTMRVGVLTAVRTFAELVGNGGSGFLLHSVGFFHTYLVCFALSITSLITGVIFIEDTSVPVEKKSARGKIFNVVKIFDGFRTVFKSTLGKKRTVVSILLIIFTTVSFSTNGEAGVLYLFLRYKFHWSERAFSLYVLYRSIGVVVGTIFCSVVLSKLFKMHDGLIGTLAGICDTIAVLGYLFARENWHLYVVPLFDIFHGAALSVSFSFLSKFYDNSELGRLSSVVNFCMLIFPLCFPVYNGIFDATMKKFPSAYFLLSFSLDTITVLLYFAAYLLIRKSELQVEAPKSIAKEEKN